MNIPKPSPPCRVCGGPRTENSFISICDPCRLRGIKARPRIEWETEGAVCFFTVPSPSQSQCGYVDFSTPPIPARSTLGLLTYLPVHGGITFNARGPEGQMVYGFDCGHCHDLKHF